MYRGGRKIVREIYADGREFCLTPGVGACEDAIYRQPPYDIRARFQNVAGVISEHVVFKPVSFWEDKIGCCGLND